MTWLVWRQHRYEILGMLIGGVLLAAALIYGADLAVRSRAEFGIDTCQPLPTTNANCLTGSMQFNERMQPPRFLITALFFVPALVGSLVGGPLFARDLERGTNRLVWSQALTRLRWGQAKLFGVVAAGAAGSIAVAAFGGRAETVTGSTFNGFQYFDLEGPAFVTHVLFAVTIAALVGTISRRILVGMLAGLLLFAAVQLGIEYKVRPYYYEEPITVVRSAAIPFPQAAVPAQAWVVRSDYVDAQGQIVPQERVRVLLESYRPTRPTTSNYDTLKFMAEQGANQRIQFQPADRYWRFQWTEGFLFLVLSAVCAGASLTLLERRDA